MLITPSFPLKLTRGWFYVVNIILALTILLPVSILMYLRFYELLIPKPDFRIPLKFSHKNNGVYSLVKLDNVQDQLHEDLNVRYNFDFNLKVVCNKWYSDVYDLEVTLYHEPFLEMKESLLFNCEATRVYQQNNALIPYNLRYWFPPILTNVERSVNIKTTLGALTGKEITQLSKTKDKPLTISLARNLLVDNSASFIEIASELQGPRYYLARYSVSSFILGVSLIWISSSLACLLTTFYVFVKK